MYENKGMGYYGRINLHKTRQTKQSYWLQSTEAVKSDNVGQCMKVEKV